MPMSVHAPDLLLGDRASLIRRVWLVSVGPGFNNDFKYPRTMNIYQIRILAVASGRVGDIPQVLSD